MKKVSVRKSGVHGKGLFADEDIKKGEHIQYIKGKPVKKVVKSPRDSERIANWIGAGKNRWMKTAGTPFRFLNHSCGPNAAITGTKTLIAMEDIPSGREITIDYSMSDADPYYRINCRCGSKRCRKEIRAIYSVPKEVFQKHMPYIPRYFQRAFIRSYVLGQEGSKGT
jgi:hypothetical protein